MGDVSDMATARARRKKKSLNNKNVEADDVGPVYAGYVIRKKDTGNALGYEYALVVESPCPEEVSVMVLVDDPSAIDCVRPNTSMYEDGVFVLAFEMNKPVEQHIVRVFPDINGIEFSLHVHAASLENEEKLPPYCEWYMEEMLGLDEITEP
jgi:hypothetical protein